MIAADEIIPTGLNVRARRSAAHHDDILQMRQLPQHFIDAIEMFVRFGQYDWRFGVVQDVGDFFS